MLVDVTAVDWANSKATRFQVVYQLLSIENRERKTIKVDLDENDLTIESLTGLYQSAFFMEREVWDMFGIEFVGHPDLRRILLYDEFVGHPLRKDYPIKKEQPRVKMLS